MASPKSAYSIPTKKGKSDTHIFVVWVDNESGVLARVVGLFSGRGYNIESLAVAEVAAIKCECCLFSCIYFFTNFHFIGRLSFHSPSKKDPSLYVIRPKPLKASSFQLPLYTSPESNVKIP